MLTIGQIRAARAFLGLSQPDLARISDVSLPTIQRLEHPKYGPAASSLRIVMQLKTALEAEGVVFLDPVDGLGEGVRLRSHNGV